MPVVAPALHGVMPAVEVGHNFLQPSCRVPARPPLRNPGPLLFWCRVQRSEVAVHSVTRIMEVQSLLWESSAAGERGLPFLDKPIDLDPPRNERRGKRSGRGIAQAFPSGRFVKSIQPRRRMTLYAALSDQQPSSGSDKKLAEAEAKLHEAEAKLHEAGLTLGNAKDDLDKANMELSKAEEAWIEGGSPLSGTLYQEWFHARSDVDTAQGAVATAQKGVAAAQDDIAACRKACEACISPKSPGQLILPLCA